MKSAWTARNAFPPRTTLAACRAPLAAEPNLTHAPSSTLRYASEKVLNGLAAIDHLMLSLAVAHPAIAAEASARVATFVSRPERRTKECVNMA